MANVSHDIPVNSKTVFDVGSVSKQFTAACIFLLEQQGKLSIDDPIQKVVAGNAHLQWGHGENTASN